MKNINKIIVLALFTTFCSYDLSATEDEKFLGENPHYEKVVKITKKVEKNLRKPVKALPKETIAPAPEPMPEPEPEITSEPSAPTPPGPEELAAEPAEQPELERTGWITSVSINGSLHFTKFDDQFGRKGRLASYPGYGASAQLGYRFNEYFALIGSYYIDRATVDSFDDITVNQPNAYLMGGKLGVRVYMTESFNMELLAVLEQHHTAYATSLTNINLERFNHGAIDLGLNYTILETDRFLIQGRTDIYTYLPTKRAKWDTELGFGGTTEFKLGVPIKQGGSVHMTFGGGYYNLRQSIANQYGIIGYMGLGLTLENL